MKWHNPPMRSATRLALATVTALTLLSACSSTTSTPATSEPAAAATSAAAALPAETAAQLQKAVDDAQAKFGFPGIIAGVWGPDGEWVTLTGTAGPEPSTPLTRDDHTRIGSITKTFTVTLLLQLAEKGLVSLDDTIDKYVPGMPNGDTATLLDLAHMTSGIIPYTAIPASTDAFFADTQKAWTPQELVDFVKGTKPQFAAGTNFQYSNTNTVLLGMVIEQVTGRPYADVVQENILGPLGMTQTSFPGSSNALPDPHLMGSTMQGNPDNTLKDATNWSPTYAFSAGEMISTLDDLHKWGVALGTGEGILSPEMQMMRLDSVPNDIPGNTPTRSYGIGIGLTNGWLGHTGEIPGYNTVLEYNPDTKTTIAIMVNTDIAVDNVNPAVAVFNEFQTILG